MANSTPTLTDVASRLRLRATQEWADLQRLYAVNSSKHTTDIQRARWAAYDRAAAFAEGTDATV